MTEAEWLTSVSVKKMTLFIASHARMGHRKSGRRKLRLFGCFSCRQLWEQMKDERSRTAVEVAERLADNQAEAAEVYQAGVAAWKAYLRVTEVAYNGGIGYQRAAETRGWLPCDEMSAAEVVVMVLGSAWRDFTSRNLFYQGTNDEMTAEEASACVSGGPRARDGAHRDMLDQGRNSEMVRTVCSVRRQIQADALRCIFGNPFRAVEVDPDWLSWNEGTVGRVARSIYNERAWDQLPVLGDALEDAGCTHEDVLGHCRGPGPHTRGCWAVDLCLGLI